MTVAVPAAPINAVPDVANMDLQHPALAHPGNDVVSPKLKIVFVSREKYFLMADLHPNPIGTDHHDEAIVEQPSVPQQDATVPPQDETGDSQIHSSCFKMNVNK
jgi:hypothetical protein